MFIIFDFCAKCCPPFIFGERGGSVVECRTPEREVRGSRPTSAVLCPWARHFTPRKYWLITQEAMAPSRHDWKIVDWDVKPQHNQTFIFKGAWVVYCEKVPLKFCWLYNVQQMCRARHMARSEISSVNNYTNCGQTLEFLRRLPEPTLFACAVCCLTWQASCICWTF